MMRIVGCPRSGTSYMMAAFRQSGWSVGDETWDGQPPVEVAIGWTHLPNLHKGIDEIVHLVREPMRTISSMQTIDDRSWVTLGKVLDMELVADIFIRLAQYWLVFTGRMDVLAKQVVQIEKSDGFLQRRGVAPLTDKKINSRQGHYAPRTLPDLRAAAPGLADRVREKGQRYGYYK